MNKIKGKAYIHISRLFFILLTAILTIAFACAFPDPFAKYRDKNLLEDLYADTTWFSDWVPDDPSGNYMAFKVVSDTDAGGRSGLPDWYDATANSNGQKPIYRLEIKNLMPNGDFESLTETDDIDLDATGGRSGIQPPGWFSAPTVSPNITYKVIDSNNSDPNESDYIIDNKCLYLYLKEPGYLLYFDMKGAGTTANPGLSGSITKDESYIVWFDFILRSDITNFNIEHNDGAYQYGNTYQPTNISTATWPYIKQEHFKLYIQDTVSPNHISINSVNTQINSGEVTASIDSIRIMQEDKPLFIRLTFNMGDRFNLYPQKEGGTYEFSLFVKQDPSTAANRFKAKDFQMNMSFVDANDYIIQGPATLIVSELPMDQWEQKTVTLQTNITTTTSPQEIYIVLAVTPTAFDKSVKDIGSLLVAAPRLEFFPD